MELRGCPGKKGAPVSHQDLRSPGSLLAAFLPCDRSPTFCRMEGEDVCLWCKVLVCVCVYACAV